MSNILEFRHPRVDSEKKDPCSGPEFNLEEIIKFAELGYKNDQYVLGYWLSQRTDPPKYSEALTWFHLAADKGHISAISALADMYQKGLGVEIDNIKACVWFSLGAFLGDEEAREKSDSVKSLLSEDELREALIRCEYQEHLFSPHKKGVAEKAKQDLRDQRIVAYRKKAESLGISSEELQQAGGAVGYALNHDSVEIIDFILTHENGPLITMYLYRNMDQVDCLNSLDLKLAIEKISGEISTKAVEHFYQSKKINDAVMTSTVKDARTALGMLRSKNFNGLIDLALDRLSILRRMNLIDPINTKEILMLAQDAKIGKEDACKKLEQILIFAEDKKYDI